MIQLIKLKSFNPCFRWTYVYTIRLEIMITQEKL